MSTAETKVCPICAETIKSVAKVCPFCQSRQARFIHWAQELGAPLIGLFYIGLFVVVSARFFPDEKGIELTFGRYRNDLAVVRTAWDRPTSKAEFWLSGFVTNQANRPWRVHELEIRLLDDSGTMWDVRQPGIEEPFVVQPGHEHAFRTRFGSVIETNRLSRYQVRVHLGSDGKREFDPD